MITHQKFDLGIRTLLLISLISGVFLASCTSPGVKGSGAISTAATIDCQVTKPAWAKPPEDSAVQGAPEFGYYYMNEDRSIWASALWPEKDEYHLRAGEDVKVGWFRPAGTELVLNGQRIDGQAPPLEFDVPCCYPTQFQASGVIFPTPGCWKISARAAQSVITFVVYVRPE
jgi:hypothetical protein